MAKNIQLQNICFSWIDLIIFIDMFNANNNLDKIEVYQKNKENAINIYFTGGGEPTLAWKKLTDTVNYIHELSERHSLCLEIGLTTNGILNPQKMQLAKIQ